MYMSVYPASRPFSLDHFDDYEKHFTVMNYKEGADMKEVSTLDHSHAGLTYGGILAAVVQQQLAAGSA